MFALGVDPAAVLAHLGRGLDESHAEGVLHVRGVVSASAAELEHLAHRAARQSPDHAHVKFRLLGVLRGWRDDQPPAGDVVVEPLRHERPPLCRSSSWYRVSAASWAKSSVPGFSAASSMSKRESWRRLFSGSFEDAVPSLK